MAQNVELDIATVLEELGSKMDRLTMTMDAKMDRLTVAMDETD